MTIADDRAPMFLGDGADPELLTELRELNHSLIGIDSRLARLEEMGAQVVQLATVAAAHVEPLVRAVSESRLLRRLLG